MSHGIAGPAPKKLKVGASKVVRERKGVSLQSKVGNDSTLVHLHVCVGSNVSQGSPPVKTKAVLPVDLKAPPLPGSWSSGGDSDEPTSSSTATLPVAEGEKGLR